MKKWILAAALTPSMALAWGGFRSARHAQIADCSDKENLVLIALYAQVDPGQCLTTFKKANDLAKLCKMSDGAYLAYAEAADRCEHIGADSAGK